MAENLYLWSTTASSNDLADPGINFQEGQTPGSVNSSARSMMATLAKHLADTNGTLATTGSANTYAIVTANTNYTVLTNGLIIVARINVTNTGPSTLNLATIGGKPINKFSNGAEVSIAAGNLIATGHYLFQYDSSLAAGGGAWILLNPSDDAGAGAWATFTPVVTSSVGAFGTVAGNIFYKQSGKIVFVRGQITITAKATADGSLLATLPVTPITSATISQIMVGREAAITGKMVYGSIGLGGATTVALLFYDNNSVIANGNIIMFSGTYEAA